MLELLLRRRGELFRKGAALRRGNLVKVTLTLTLGRILPHLRPSIGYYALNRAPRRCRKTISCSTTSSQASGLGRHLTPSEISCKGASSVGRASDSRPSIAVSQRLRDLGLVSELYLPGADSATYEPVGPRHAHFRCSKCGEIEDVDYAIPAAHAQALALAARSSRSQSERVTFEGRCATCRRSR